MILYLYANYNKKADFFGSIVAEKIDPIEMKDNYLQIICNLSSDLRDGLKDCDLYTLGTFDNVSGEIKHCKEFILCCGDAVSILEAKENGTKSKESN